MEYCYRRATRGAELDRGPHGCQLIFNRVLPDVDTHPVRNVTPGKWSQKKPGRRSLAAGGTNYKGHCKERAGALPIVFVNVTAPVGAQAWSQDLARPGGNATGFTQSRIRRSAAKWLGTAQGDRAGIRE